MVYITYYIVITLLMKCLFKRDTSFILCGMAGISMFKSLKPEQLKVVKQKLKILGLYNQSRGAQGCGWLINDLVHKGHNDLVLRKDTSLFKDFIANEELPDFNLKEYSVSFLHCRQASSGKISKENNHPFFIDNSMYLAHNGTIRNITELCKEYEISSNFSSVDSYLLGSILNKGHYEVLDKYEGTAALLWRNENDPHSLYVYHGSSIQTYNSYKDEEERPLYYLIGNEGVYFSSILDSLEAIKDNTNQKVECLKYNSVFKLTHGVFVEETYKVTRPLNYNKTNYSNNYWEKDYLTNNSTTNYPTIVSKSIWYEKFPENFKQNHVVFWKGRYYEYIKNTMSLLNGEYNITDKGEFSKSGKSFYFVKGVFIKNKFYYEKYFENLKSNDVFVNFAKQISAFSKYPVCSTSQESLNCTLESRKTWFANGYELKGSSWLNFKWSSRSYLITEGKLINIKSSISENTISFFENFEIINYRINNKKDYKSRNPTFNTIFSSEEDLFNNLDYNEIASILSYTNDLLFYKEGIRLYDATCKHMIELLSEAVKFKKTISEIYEDEEDLLGTYSIWAETGGLEDDLFAYYLDNYMKKEISEEDVIPEACENICTSLEDIKSFINELQTVDTDLAQNLANAGYKNYDWFIYGFTDIFEQASDKIKEKYKTSIDKFKKLI